MKGDVTPLQGNVIHFDTMTVVFNHKPTIQEISYRVLDEVCLIPCDIPSNPPRTVVWLALGLYSAFHCCSPDLTFNSHQIWHYVVQKEMLCIYLAFLHYVSISFFLSCYEMPTFSYTYQNWNFPILFTENIVTIGAL